MTQALLGLRRRIAGVSVGPIGLILGLYLVLGIGVIGPRITTDGLLYLAESRSAVLDGDLDVADEYRFDPALQIPGASEGRREFLPRDLDGRFLHTANEGIIVLFAPFILVGHAVASLVAVAGGPVSIDGYDLPYVLAIGFGTNAMVALALALLAGYARRYVGLAAAVGGAAAVWVGSSLFHWSVFRPGHAHAPAVLLESLFVVLFLARARDPRDRTAWLVMGAVWGLMVSVRPITGLYAIVPLLWLGWLAGRPVVETIRDGGLRRGVMPVVVDGLRLILPAGLFFVAGGFLGRLPQLALTGDVSIAGSAYYEESGFLDSVVGGPLDGVGSLLLDPSQGSLWWVPIVPLAIAGLAWYWRRDRLVAVAGVVWVAAIWVFIGMLGYPQRFGGPTYASRHLVEATPIYVLGAAGLIPLVRAGVAALVRGRRAVATIVSAGVLVLSAAWGAVQYIASEAVPGAAGLDPIARIARILSNPGSLRRLLVGGPVGEPEPGVAFIGGRLAAGLDDRGAVAEVALAVVILAGLGVAWAAIARWGLGWALSPSGPVTPSGRVAPVGSPGQHVAGRRADGARWAGRVAWLVAAIVALALVGPSLVRPRLAGPEGDRAISTWTAGTGAPADGRIERIVVGASLTGNAVVSPPFVEQGAPDPGAPPFESAPGAFADLPAGGLSAEVELADDWSALTGLGFHVEATAATAGLVIELWRPMDDEPALLVEVPPAALHGGVVTVATPVALAPTNAPEPGLVDVRIRPYGEGRPPRLGLTASGELALESRGIATGGTPEIRLAGRTLFEPHVGVLPQASIDVRADGPTKMRVGPWSPELLLRSATDETGWSFPGPSADPGTWTDSVIKSSPSGSPLVVRVDAPWPIRTASASAMVTSLVRDQSADVVVEGSSNGSAFTPVATYKPTRVDRQQVATGTFTPTSAATSIWFTLDLVGSSATTSINGVWFDLELVPPEAALTSLSAATAGQIEVSPSSAAPGGATLPVTVDVAVDPTIVERVAWTTNDAVTSAISAPGPILLLLLAGALLVAARLALPAAGRPAAVGVLVLAIVFLGIGVVALPRTVLLPRTQALADGVLDGAIGEGPSIVATAADATYVSPIISIPVGSRVDGVRLGGRPGKALVTIRTVATDGTPGPWLDPTSAVRTEADGLQVRVEFEKSGSRLDRIRIDYRPPLGS